MSDLKEGEVTSKEVSFKNIEKRIEGLLFFPHYQNFLRAMRRTLWLSRISFLKNNGKFLLFLQKVMAIQLSKLQEIQKEGNKLLASKTSIKEQEVIKRRMDMHKELARILQTIADGIAWRNMGFQRALMRVFSENDAPGSIAKELGIIGGLRCKGIIIVNDLTRFCRIADFTRIFPDGRIILYEAKTKENKRRTALKDMGDILKKVQGPGTPKLTRQDRRQILAQKAVINRKIEIPIFREKIVEKSLEADIVDIDIKIVTHFKGLKQAIKIAKKNLWGGILLEHGYFLSVKAYDALLGIKGDPEQEIEKRWQERQKSAPEWVKTPTKNVLIVDTYLSFINEHNEFARNIIPYSILPLSTEDCVALMSGHIRAKLYYDLSYLEQRLKDAGWDVERLNFEGINGVRTEREMFEKDSGDELFLIRKKIGIGVYSTTISCTEILQMMSSFYATDFILDSQDYKQGDKGSRVEGSLKISPNFPNEKYVLR